MFRFQEALSVFSASAAAAFVPSVSTRSSVQPFASGYDSVARSASTASVAALISSWEISAALRSSETEGLAPAL